MGSAQSTNVANMVASTISNETVKVSNIAGNSCTGSNVIRIKKAKSVHIEGNKMVNRCELQLKSVFKELSKQTSKQDMMQQLDQKAKAMVKGFTAIGTSEASSTMYETMKAAINLTDETVNSCTSQATTNNVIDLGVVDGPVDIKDNLMSNMTKVATSCVASIEKDQGTTQTMSQKAAQVTDASVSGVPWAALALFVFACAVFWIVLKGGLSSAASGNGVASGKTSAKALLLFGLLLLVVDITFFVLVYNQVFLRDSMWQMTKYAYSPLIKACNLSGSGTSSTGVTSAETASEQCLGDRACWAADYQCWDKDTKSTVTPKTTMYNFRIPLSCIDELKDRQHGPSTYTPDGDIKTPQQLDNEINYSMIKTFRKNWWLLFVSIFINLFSVLVFYKVYPLILKV